MFKYTLGLLEGAPMLARLIEAQRTEAIDRTNRVTVEVHTASFRAVLGYTIAAAILDEVAFWPTDDAAEPDTEIVAAIRPGMATIPGSLLLAISSPYARRGSMWQAYRDHYGKDGSPVLVWRAPTAAMNPTVPQQVIDAAYEQDAIAASAEYGAEFRRDVESFVSVETIDGAVVPGRRELPPVPGVRYSAFIDPSGGSADSMTRAIAHREKRDGAEVLVLDALGERRPPFSPEDVAAEFCSASATAALPIAPGVRPRTLRTSAGAGSPASHRARRDPHLVHVPPSSVEILFWRGTAPDDGAFVAHPSVQPSSYALPVPEGGAQSIESRPRPRPRIGGPAERAPVDVSATRTMSRLPDFVIIGAARCATTSLYAYLREHPEVFMSPEKETDFFSLGDLLPSEVPLAASAYRARTREEYEHFFRGAGRARAVGEASPTYLFYPRSAARMQQTIPEAKLICILRDPIERAYSHYALARKMGFEVLSDFEAAVAAEDERWRHDRSMRFTYTRASFYHDGLREFWKRFARERILVLLFEDLAADPAGTMRTIYDFVGVDPGFTPDLSIRHNRSMLPRSTLVREAFGRPFRLRRFLQRSLPPHLVTHLGNLIMRPPPGLTPPVRARLLPRFVDETRRLETLLDRDLSSWRSI